MSATPTALGDAPPAAGGDPSAAAGPACYEAPAWRSLEGGLLRPGGLELTDRGIDGCGLASGARVLDVGCGVGATVQHLIAGRGLAAVGVDASADLVAAGRARVPGLPLVVARAGAVPFEDRSFDAVLLECAWSAIAGSTGGSALGELRRVLRPRGWLVASDVYARTPASPTGGEGAGGEGAGGEGAGSAGAGTVGQVGADGAAGVPAGAGSVPGAASYPLGRGCWAELPGEAEVRRALETAGFRLERWEDHSATLRTFAARLIFEGGSLAAYLGSPGQGAAGDALRALRPGYFLLVARRD